MNQRVANQEKVTVESLQQWGRTAGRCGSIVVVAAIAVTLGIFVSTGNATLALAVIALSGWASSALNACSALCFEKALKLERSEE